MATFNKFQPFVEHLAEGVHNLGADTLILFLCAAANAPLATDATLSDQVEAAYTNLSSRTLTVSSSAQTSGTYRCIVNDLVLTSTGGTTGPFRYVGVYNDTPTSPADPVIGWYDYGSDLTLQDGEQFTFDADGTNGLISIA